LQKGIQEICNCRCTIREREELGGVTGTCTNKFGESTRSLAIHPRGNKMMKISEKNLNRTRKENGGKQGGKKKTNPEI
jgi:hypothetical protein